MPRNVHVAVVGAGAFGGWTALHLKRKGARITLVDSWGPGNSRASSGDETRVIRGGYGADRIYVELVVRSLELWRRAETEWGRKLYHQTGALWMVQVRDEYERAIAPLLREAGLRVDELTTAEASERFPQIDFHGVSRAIYEHDAGYLLARRSCQAVLEAAIREGVDYRQRAATVERDGGGDVLGLSLSDGARVEADLYVFACGPWLSDLFPEVVPRLVSPTRQEVFYFGTRAGDTRYLEGSCPVWIDWGERVFYGIPGNDGRGFKVADDRRGPAFDPTSSDRRPSEEGILAARAYLESRFPGMKGAPLVEARVCQYEQSRDGHFYVDWHPGSRKAFLLGGGSGHGFKHGPAVGELAAAMVLGERSIEPFFSIARTV